MSREGVWLDTRLVLRVFLIPGHRECVLLFRQYFVKLTNLTILAIIVDYVSLSRRG